MAPDSQCRQNYEVGSPRERKDCQGGEGVHARMRVRVYQLHHERSVGEVPAGEKKDGQRGRYPIRHDFVGLRELFRGLENLFGPLSRDPPRKPEINRSFRHRWGRDQQFCRRWQCLRRRGLRRGDQRCIISRWTGRWDDGVRSLLCGSSQRERLGRLLRTSGPAPRQVGWSGLCANRRDHGLGLRLRLENGNMMKDSKLCRLYDGKRDQLMAWDGDWNCGMDLDVDIGTGDALDGLEMANFGFPLFDRLCKVWIGHFWMSCYYSSSMGRDIIMGLLLRNARETVIVILQSLDFSEAMRQRRVDTGFGGVIVLPEMNVHVLDFIPSANSKGL